MSVEVRLTRLVMKVGVRPTRLVMNVILCNTILTFVIPKIRRASEVVAEKNLKELQEENQDGGAQARQRGAR